MPLIVIMIRDLLLTAQEPTPLESSSYMNIGDACFLISNFVIIIIIIIVIWLYRYLKCLQSIDPIDNVLFVDIVLD